MVLLTLAALAAGWLAVAVEQAARGAVGTLVGIPWSGLALSSRFTLIAVPRPTAATLGAGALTLVQLTGPLVLLVLALGTHFLLGLFRTRGWLKALALEWAVLALLWTPTALVVAVFENAGGPFAELYRRLGDPQAGRWATVGLGALLLWLLGRVVASRAIAVGRAWMRTDALEFRRRLVRVVAGYPVAIALGVVMVVGAWASPLWSVIWLTAVLGVLVVRTP